MKRIYKVLGLFTTKRFIDIWCFVALIRFILGKQIDSVTLGIIIGAYTVHNGIKNIKGEPDAI